MLCTYVKSFYANLNSCVQFNNKYFEVIEYSADGVSDFGAAS